VAYILEAGNRPVAYILEAEEEEEDTCNLLIFRIIKYIMSLI
jgi:hypothetical protein